MRSNWNNGWFGWHGGGGLSGRGSDILRIDNVRQIEEANSTAHHDDIVQMYREVSVSECFDKAFFAVKDLPSFFYLLSRVSVFRLSKSQNE